MIPGGTPVPDGAASTIMRPVPLHVNIVVDPDPLDDALAVRIPDIVGVPVGILTVLLPLPERLGPLGLGDVAELIMKAAVLAIDTHKEKSDRDIIQKLKWKPPSKRRERAHAK